MPFPKDCRERISINSFGLGGANAHAIIESAAEYHSKITSEISPVVNRTPTLLVFSANHPTSLEKTLEQYHALVAEGSVSLRDLSYTLGARRDHMTHKAFAIADGKSFDASPATKSSSSPPPAFVFTGQGAQWPTMGKELMEDYESFRADMQKMDDSLAQLKHAPSWKISDELLKSDGLSNIHKAEMSQPLCTAVQVALVNLLQSWGISLSAVVGHSSGEIAAAYAAGAFNMDTAIRIAFYRGFVANVINRKGSMAAIGLGRNVVEPYLTSGVVLACENSGGSVTISGDEDVVQNTIAKILIDSPDALARRLKVEIGYHSHHMADVGELYENLIQKEFAGANHELTIPFYSSVTGNTYLHSEGLGASYWRENLESPVLFYGAAKSLLAASGPGPVMLEVGPHSALQGPLRQMFKETASSAFYASCLTRGSNSTISLLRAVGQLHCNGVKVDFGSLFQGGTSLPNLPTYAWNHDNVYWRESRLSRDYRSRKYPHHDLLGSRVLESTDIEPTWRGSLDLGRLPWLQEHALHIDIVFPAAGFVATVGEAIRQVSNGVEEYMVRNVVVASALIILPLRPSEVITRFSRHRLTKSNDSAWYDFTIISNNGNGWTRNCFGQVRSGRPVHVEVPELKEYSRKVTPQRWYRQMHKIGLQYGQAFRGLHDMSASPTKHEASAHIVDRPREGQSPYVFHPCSLDWVFQAFGLAAHHGVSRHFDKMCLPAYIEELYIASGGENIHINLATSVVPGGAFTCAATGVSGGEVKFLLKGMKIEPFDDASAAVDDRSHGAVQLEWRPDLDFVDASTLLHQVPDIKEGHCIIEKLSLLCSAESAEILKEIAAPSEYLEKYRKWTEERLARARNDDNPLLPDAADLVQLGSSQRQDMIEELMERSRGSRIDAPAEAIYIVYKSIEGLYKGEIDILEVLLKGDVLTNLYNFLNADCHDFMQLLGHSKPTLRVLEIGAGTGGLTALVMEALHTSYDERMYSKYTYTDISAGFFVAAQERFKNMPGVECAVLDISQDPTAQGFEAGAYDLIIASNVLHATPSLEETLRHCRTLLHPQGRLFLQELCSQSKWINYIMGVLPGWWLGEADGRGEEPYVGYERWHEELRKAGFAGVDTFFQDQDSPYQFNAHIVARPALATLAPGKVAFLTNSHIPEQAREIESLFVKNGYSVEYRTLEQGPTANIDTLALLDLDKAFLHDATSQDFDSFIKFAHGLGSSRLLWVTKASQIAVKDPRYALILGMARAIRSELGATFGTLELEEFNSMAWQPLLDVFKKFQQPPAVGTDQLDLDADVEYALSGGLINTPRFHWITVGEQLARTKNTAMKGLWVGKPGLIQSMEWRPFDFPELSPEHVEVETRAAGLNFKVRMKQLSSDLEIHKIETVS
jgi:malonyl CoA-acyl carrier protein transacylase/SAM-dependent methyltransferase